MLKKYRKKIDKIDKKLAKLFEKRMDVARSVGKYKKEHNIEIYVDSREKEIFKKITAQIKNPEYKKYALDFFEIIMGISKELQSKSSEKEK